MHHWPCYFQLPEAYVMLYASEVFFKNNSNSFPTVMSSQTAELVAQLSLKYCMHIVTECLNKGTHEAILAGTMLSVMQRTEGSQCCFPRQGLLLYSTLILEMFPLPNYGRINVPFRHQNKVSRCSQPKQTEIRCQTIGERKSGNPPVER